MFLLLFLRDKWFRICVLGLGQKSGAGHVRSVMKVQVQLDAVIGVSTRRQSALSSPNQPPSLVFVFFSTPDSNIRPMWIKFPLTFLLNIVHVLRVSDDACVLCPSSLPVWLTVRLQAINTHRQRQYQLCFTNTHSLTRVTWTSPLLSKTKIFFFKNSNMVLKQNRWGAASGTCC